MATAVKIKTPSNTFTDIHKPYIKTGAATWSEGVKIYHKKSSDKWQLVWDAGDAAVEINITSNRTDFNVYNHLVGLGLDPASQPYNVVINVSNGAVLGASSTASYGLATGALKSGSKLTLNVAADCYISGAGGAGGFYYVEYHTTRDESYITGAYGLSGGNGGTAILLTSDITINNQGTIQGGGGGGGGNMYFSSMDTKDYYSEQMDGSGTGGGAGSFGGAGASNNNGSSGNTGTLTYGGVSSNIGKQSPSTYGKGGEPGTAGNAGACLNMMPYYSGGAGGAGGQAIITNGNTITWLNQGTILGNIT